MPYNAFILEDNNDVDAQSFNLRQFMVWVQSPAGAWLLLQGTWPTPTSAKRFVDRAGYHLIDTDLGLRQLDQQLVERQQQVPRNVLHLKSVN